ncbi:hypothetical protein Q5752_004421 [Cryptotrichosporon argae]
MSSQPPSHATAPGPPVTHPNILPKAAPGQPVARSGTTTPCNPYDVDLVVTFSIAIGSGDRKVAEVEIKEGYETLLRALEGEGLRIASAAGRAGKGKEEVWVFVGGTEQVIDRLVEREKLLDQAHGLPPHSSAIPPSPATRLRLLYDLLTAPPIQDGLGITPGKGKWKRVKSIAALHDEEHDQQWVKQWTDDWTVGLLKGLDDGGRGLGEHQTPPVHLYFHFLSTYTLSLLPLSVISVLFYFFTPADSYPPLYAFALAVYSTTFIAVWRIKERKLAVRWGTRGCESVAVSRLRPEYVANSRLDELGAQGDGLSVVDAVRAGDDLKRDAKVALSVPIIVACGAMLGVVLCGIFMLEAFVSEIYEGAGKQVVPLIPTALFSLVVPQVVALFNALSGRLVYWEDHPTPVGSDKSLTAKTFAMNAIVAYLGLYLSAYVYVPFGPQIMSYVQQRMASTGQVKVAETPEKAGLGPRSESAHQHRIKAGRLKGQLFAYTVTNQVINTFLETGLPFILRFVNDWRAGKTTVKEAVKTRGHYGEDAKPASTPEEVEKRFLYKVERELALPDYRTFTDYAEMVTQFGYVTVWSIVWPLAPVFALVNNYFEIRTDALKICKHVRRPIGDRVETVGSWLHTLSIISWLGAVTSSTLIYLFRPLALMHHAAPLADADRPVEFGSAPLSHFFSAPLPALQRALPTAVPVLALALAASHAHIVLRWAIDHVAERVLWRGSAEEREVHRMREGGGAQVRERLKRTDEDRKAAAANGDGAVVDAGAGFWNGGEEGARAIGRLLKTE